MFIQKDGMILDSGEYLLYILFQWCVIKPCYLVGKLLGLAGVYLFTRLFVSLRQVYRYVFEGERFERWFDVLRMFADPDDIRTVHRSQL
jgi:hypothetical protein